MTRKLARTICHAGLSGLAIAATANICPAFAQSPGDQGDLSPDKQTSAVSEVVVTGQKFAEQTLQKTPISVSVISEHDIETAGVNTLQDVARLTPNFVIDNHYRPGTQNISFRGFTNVTGGKSPFAVIVDGVEEPNQEYLLQPLFDVQQIEVLRGPQGVLYGAGAIAGAINIVTQKPTNEFAAQVKMSGFEGNEFTGQGSISGPIVDDVVRYRLSGYVKSFRGLIEDVTTHDYVDRESDYGVQGQLLIEPATDTSIDLRARFFNEDSGGLWLERTPAAQIDTYSQPPDGDINGYQRRHVGNLSATVKHDFDALTLTSISGYQSGKTFGLTDGDFTAAPITAEDYTYNVDILNEELRLTSRGEQRFNWLVSGFAQRQKVLDENAYGPVLAPGDYAFAPPTTANLYRSVLWALAAEGRYKLTDALTLIAGGRYDHDKESALDLSLNELNRQNYSQFQPKAALTYQATEAVLLYADYSRGFRSGGFNPNSPIGAREYTNETSDTYEIGEKTSFLRNRVILDLAQYYTNYKNEQFIYAVPLPRGNFSSIANIPRSRSYGGEIEAQGVVTNQFRLNASYGYAPTQVRSFPVTGHPTDAFVDNYIPHVYKYTIGGGGEYNVPLTREVSLLARLDVSHRSRVFYNIVNTLDVGPKTFVNGRIELESTRQWTLAFVGRNLFNERTNAAVGGSPFLAPAIVSRSYSEPRQLGIEFGLKF